MGFIDDIQWVPIHVSIFEFGAICVVLHLFVHLVIAIMQRGVLLMSIIQSHTMVIGTTYMWIVE